MFLAAVPFASIIVSQDVVSPASPPIDATHFACRGWLARPALIASVSVYSMYGESRSELWIGKSVCPVKDALCPLQGFDRRVSPFSSAAASNAGNGLVVPGKGIGVRPSQLKPL